MRQSPSVPAAVGQVVRDDPERTAILDGERRVSYGELWRASGGIAEYLRHHQVVAGDRVGVSAGRGPHAIAAMLGVVRVGATFVPLDDADPPARRRQIVSDADLSAMLVDEGRQGQIEGIPAIAIAEAFTRASSGAFDGDHSARSPMYVMYTSGSTGVPKGVVIEHASVLALVAETRLNLSRSSVVAHLASQAFDASIFEIWGPLCHGGAVVVIDPVDLLDDPDRLAALSDHGVNSAFVTTALFNHLLSRRAEGLFSLDRLFFGGEKADPGPIAEFLRRRGSAVTPHLMHCYGPTEATVFSTMAELDIANYTQLSIGYPLGHVIARVVDGTDEVCPDGEPGELVLMGAGLAKEYWRSPERTAEKFVEMDPGDGRRVRAYRTGDVCQMRDGQLYFVGRRDEMVKLRGHRIDLGEVEAALRLVERVIDARVVSVGTGEEHRLVGFVRAGHGLTASEIRTALLERIPAYMVPHDLRLVDDFGLSASGKVDLSLLRALAAGG